MRKHRSKIKKNSKKTKHRGGRKKDAVTKEFTRSRSRTFSPRFFFVCTRQHATVTSKEILRYN